MRAYNFSAGPAVLPEPVLRQAAAEMLDWHGSGMSVMEMSHRGPEFIQIAAEAEADLRTLMAVGDDYAVLFLQGGAIGENAIVPMNLLGDRKTIDFINTGEWSKKSIKEAKKYAQVNVAASSEDQNFSYVPKRESWKLSDNAAYVHVCTNETIGGVEYHWVPDVGATPLVADMSSHILSGPIDVSKYGVIYGGAQKNVGPAGLTLVIVRGDLLDRALPITPSAFHWKEQAEAEGLDKVFLKAGFEWREPGCSMCLAMNPDKLKPEERCASTSNRNFEGRQGFKGRTHLVSPAMAAAARSSIWE